MFSRRFQKLLINSLAIGSAALLLFGLALYHNSFSAALAAEQMQLASAETVLVDYDPNREAQAVNPLAEPTEDSTFEQAAAQRAKKYPRLIIPSIGVNAVVENVALTAQGSMGVPKNPLNAAWYELGPKPGEVGSAVIDGHVDWFNGARAVFKNLSKVNPGDKIQIQNESGEVITFIARESRIFDPAADALTVFSSNDGQAHLNLITCGGVWNKVTKQYSERLVIFADRKLP